MGTDPQGGRITVTPIFWVPPGYSARQNYQSVINGYLSNVAADSGKPTNVFSVATQYTDASGNHIRYNLSENAPIVDATAPTAGGCTPDSGPIYADNSSYTGCIDDAQLQSEVTTVLASHGLASDQTHMYVVLLPKGIESCFTNVNGAGGGNCTVNPTTSGFCGYHSATTGTSAIYANIPFPIYSSPTPFGCGPQNQGGPGLQSPNGDSDADVVTSILSHEMNEAITDPFGNAWYDSSGNENGDDCNFIYGGGFSGTPGAYYNQTINGAHYFTQEEFSNAAYVPNVSGCVQNAQDPIAAHYTAVGGSGSYLGNPVGGEYDVAGGRGQDYTGGSIFYSSSTGAWAVHGAILGTYRNLGGPGGVLSFPTSDETGTPDGVGRFNAFAGTGGSGIYWTPNTGAHAVQGAIYAGWASLGYERGPLGYPTSDETPTPDGVGRFNAFAGTGGSGIYWTPNTGAHAVQGAIYAQWASLGYERGPLGYPTSDEYAIPGGRGSDFTGGTITWQASTNTTQTTYR